MQRVRVQKPQHNVETDKAQRSEASAHLRREITIVSKIQRTKHDCGQTVLEMLGYNGHKLFPGQSLHHKDLKKLSGVTDVPFKQWGEEEIDYSAPKIWMIRPPLFQFGPDNHWVIRYKDKIYCPSVGEMDAKAYKVKYVMWVLKIFDVPFKPS